MDNEIIRSIGVIVKQEKLATVEHDTNSKALIFESLLPYPGYHGTTIPDTLEPESLFAVTKSDYSDVEIIRAIQKVKQVCKVKFDAAPGTIQVENNPANIIRFKDLDYSKVGDVISHFEKNGIEFNKKSKKIAPYDSIIRILKYFDIKRLGEGIYEDNNDKEFFYLRVDRYVDWETFEKITKQIKYNIQDLKFDGAQLSVYDSTGMVDFVRIYDKNRYTDKLSTIRNYYLKAYSKL